VPRRLSICPIGPVEEIVLSRIRDCIEKHCGLRCRIVAGMEHPEYAFDEKRLQYNAKHILKNLIRCCPEGAMRFMGVTGVDLFVPILKYVFGLAEMEGTCSVISTHRLRQECYEQPPDRDLLLLRVEKTAMHELGHCFGLTHCRDRRCVMFSSTRIEDTDMKKAYFCPTCSELFRWYMDRFLDETGQ
jgi:archaemetzincin